MGCSPKKCNKCKNIYKACQLQNGLCSKCRGVECYYTVEIVNFNLTKLQCVKDGNKDIGLTPEELDQLINNLTLALNNPCKQAEAIKQASLLLPKIKAVEC